MSHSYRRGLAVVATVWATLLPASARAQTGPIAAYSFDEGSGTTAKDARTLPESLGMRNDGVPGKIHRS